MFIQFVFAEKHHWIKWPSERYLVKVQMDKVTSSLRTFG
jgi:hypothetical protein